MFAYCNSNPVNRVDYTGARLEAYKGDLSGYGGGGFSFPLPLPIPLPFPRLNERLSEIVDDVKSWVETQKGIKEYRDNCVYVLKDPTNNNLVKYVGRTNDPIRRAQEHKNDPFHPQRSNYNMVVLVTGLTKNEAMAVEQFLISAYTLDYLENARREIAIRRIPQFEAYIGAIAEIHTGIPGSTILELMMGR